MSAPRPSGQGRGRGGGNWRGRGNFWRGRGNWRGGGGAGGTRGRGGGWRGRISFIISWITFCHSLTVNDCLIFLGGQAGGAGFLTNLNDSGALGSQSSQGSQPRITSLFDIISGPYRGWKLYFHLEGM